MGTLTQIYNVSPIAQSKPNSCWAASAAMLLSWKASIPISEQMAAHDAGSTFEYAFNADSGLYGSEIANFAAALGLTTEAPQNYTAAGYSQLLAQHGPLWVGTAIFSTKQTYKHVRVLRGIDGNDDSDAILYIVDPAGGRDYMSSVADFAKELEQIAIDDLGDESDGNLWPQIIRF
jgi:hypothetical protein